MKNFLFTLLLSVFLIPSGLAQSTYNWCATEATVNPDYSVDDFRQFKQYYQKTNNNSEDGQLWVPITAHLIRASDSTKGISIEDFLFEFDRLNAAYLSGGIQFYLCGPIDEIYDDKYVNYNSDNEDQMRAQYSVENTINVFIAEKTSYGTTAVCGYSYMPWSQKDFVVLARSCAMNGSTLAHELGHNLGLYHTHSTENGQEYVDGTNCDIAGDLLCDTPADPGLSGKVSNCTYVGSNTDPNGETYDPDVNNMMSYSSKVCRTNMSVEQQLRAAYHVPLYKDHLTCDQVVNGDLFPDNAAVSSSKMNVAEAYNVVAVQIYRGDTLDQLFSMLGVYLSTDDQLSSSDIYLGSKISEFSNNQNFNSAELEIMIPNDVISGSYNLLFVADNNNGIQETNESNNILSISVDVENNLVSYNIATKVDPVNSGEVSGGGTYLGGSVIQLNATPVNSDWTFGYWKNSDGSEVYNQPTIEILVSGSDTYTAHFEKTIGIEEYSEVNTYVYPNPVGDVLTLTTVENYIGTSALVLNIMGQELLEFTIRNLKQEVNFSQYQNGVYFIKLQSGKEIDVLKFIKE